MLGARLRSRTRARNGGKRPLAAQIRAMYAQGEQGLWYDPSDLSTLFQDAAGTTPVTAVGQPVGKILDKSGRGNHASQPTAVARPLLHSRINWLQNTETLATQSVTVRNTLHCLSFWGTGSVTLSGAATGTLTGTGPNDRVYLEFTTTAGSLTLTVGGSVTRAQLEESS